MKEFKNPQGQLAGLAWGTRFIYTIFLAFCLTGYGVMAAMMVSRSGLSSRAMVDYYAGHPAEGRYGKTFNELLELTHFHLFSIPLLLLVQGHLFLMTRWPRPAKVAAVTTAFIGGALNLAMPWALAYGSPALAPLATVGRLLLMGSFLLFSIVPLWEMWGPPPRRRGRPSGTPTI